MEWRYRRVVRNGYALELLSDGELFPCPFCGRMLHYTLSPTQTLKYNTMLDLIHATAQDDEACRLIRRITRGAKP